LPEAAKTVAYVFISSRLDYCNSLLFGISNSLLRASSGCTKRYSTPCCW